MLLVKRIIVIMCAQKIIKVSLNLLKLFRKKCRLFSEHGVDCTSTTQLGKLFKILTIRAEKKYF